MRVICLHRDALDRLLVLGTAIRDLTPTGVVETPYHLVAASPEQAKALKALRIDHEDITPSVLRDTEASGAPGGFLYCRGGKIPDGTRLRTTYKARTFEAEVRGGAIWFNGRSYDNPSAAARGAGYGSVNGWKVWEFLDPKDGRWRTLERLRTKSAAWLAGRVIPESGADK